MLHEPLRHSISTSSEQTTKSRKIESPQDIARHVFLSFPDEMARIIWFWIGHGGWTSRYKLSTSSEQTKKSRKIESPGDIACHIFWSFLNRPVRIIWFSNQNFRFSQVNGKYPRVHFGGKTFRIEGLGGSKCGWEVGWDFHWNFRFKLTYMTFCVFLPPAGLTESCSFWFDLKDLYPCTN